MIAIDAEKGTLDLEVSEAELAKRRKAWKAPANPYQSGVLRKYADQVGPARKGAVTHAGGSNGSCLLCGHLAGSWRRSLIAARRAPLGRRGVKYASPQAAFEQGLGAYKSGYYEIAIPALEEAATKGAGAQPVLRRVLSGAHLLRQLERADQSRQGLRAVPEARRRECRRRSRGRPARAVRGQGADGARRLPAARRQGDRRAPDPDRAVDYLQHAATFFGDKDAQFELAKVYSGRPHAART